MTGRQNIPTNANAQVIENPIQADARSLVDTAQIIDMNRSSKELTTNKKKHTNTTSIVVGFIGSSIIGFIIYNLIVNTY